ncbi:hypothetical protein M011DRAFT_478755 [Sporormia fimetaria CBS 119925]|uniref:Uncharacterized protein n=1 Tax=Sporormia fimetaria CBS 119925 TaxID=1340428 RepID=A0A6A6V8F2_9PLEO|nr:hypothetical protein M011DRAFT_478755 [Sporormia fimetaria CBS 119925]
MNNYSVPFEPAVYTGVWTNWSKGKVLGTTLTVNQRDSNLLVAFLALFASYAGTSFFRISCFALHHFYSSKAPRSVLYHQRQAILRNAYSGASAAAALAQLLWTGRVYSRKRGLLRQTLPLLVFGVAITVAFFFASLYSSRISELTGDEVMIVNPTAHLWSTQPDVKYDEDLMYNVVNQYISKRWNAYANYAQTCYDDDNRRGGDCNFYYKPRLYTKIDRNASCPFTSGICRSASKNLKIDTGYLDTHADLGLNTPPSQRLQFRQVLHCAPISTDGYAIAVNATTSRVDYHYGRIVGQDSDVTYSQLSDRDDSNPGALRLEQPSYSVGAAIAWTQAGEYSETAAIRSWLPIPELRENNFDITLIWLSGQRVKYPKAVEDPWFSAHSAHQPGSADQQFYRADEPRSPLACTSQFEVCVPDGPGKRRCTQPGGMLDHVALKTSAPNDTFVLEKDFITKEVFNHLSLDIPFSVLGDNVLEARYTMRHGRQIALPDDQWQREVIRWSNIMLSTVQGRAVDLAIGPWDPRLCSLNIMCPTNKVELRYARSQKVRSTAYANFSVLGLSITLGVGGLVVFLQLLLESFYIHSSRLGVKRYKYQRLEWCVNGTLQLQRLAHEELGYGKWSKCDDHVPLEDDDSPLAVLNLKNVKHPRLSGRPVIKRQDTESGTILPLSSQPTLVEAEQPGK